MSRFKFGARSLQNLATVEPKLQAALRRALSYGIMDFTIICGHRGKAEQDEAYSTGRSKVQFPNSKHNTNPSVAVDVAPWPIDWTDSLAFARLAGIISAAASEEGISLRWGGDWDKDSSSKDQSFMDIGHLEITTP